MLVPDGAVAANNLTGTNTVPFPKTELYDNCSMAVMGPNGTTLWHTNTTSVGPCDLVINADGTMSIIDQGNGNATLWSNAAQFINTTAMCSPFTVEQLSSGKLVEKVTATTTLCGRRLGCLHLVGCWAWS